MTIRYPEPILPDVDSVISILVTVHSVLLKLVLLVYDLSIDPGRISSWVIPAFVQYLKIEHVGISYFILC